MWLCGFQTGATWGLFPPLQFWNLLGCAASSGSCESQCSLMGEVIQCPWFLLRRSQATPHCASSWWLEPCLGQSGVGAAAAGQVWGAPGELAQCCSAWDLQTPRLPEHHLKNSYACRCNRQKEPSDAVFVMRKKPHGSVLSRIDEEYSFRACCEHCVSRPLSLGGSDNQPRLPLVLSVKPSHRWDRRQSALPGPYETH